MKSVLSVNANFILPKTRFFSTSHNYCTPEIETSGPRPNTLPLRLSAYHTFDFLSVGSQKRTIIHHSYDSQRLMLMIPGEVKRHAPGA